MPDYTAPLNRARAKAKKPSPKKSPSKGTGGAASEITVAEFVLIGAIAVTNDILDWLGVDLLLFRAFDLLTFGALALWCAVRLKKFPTSRLGGSFFIEMIPGLGEVSPTWTIFIISIYLEQKGFRLNPMAKKNK